MPSDIGRKIAFNVAAAELLIAPPLSIGAVYCLDKFFREQMQSVKQFVAKHIVEPHHAFIQEFGANVLKAHGRYLKHGEQAIEPGETPENKLPFAEASPEEQALRVSNVLVKGIAAFGTEVTVSYLAQKTLNDILKVPKSQRNEMKVVFTDAAVHLGSIAVFATVLAQPAEWLRDKLETIFEKTGMRAKEAGDAARTLVYVFTPGLFALAASMKVAHQAASQR